MSDSPETVRVTAQMLGVLIGGGIAIVSTVANLIYNWFQRRSEQKYLLRQNVYLQACEGVAQGAQYLGKFSRMDIDDYQLFEIMSSNSGWGNKVQTVANQETIEAFTASGEYLFNKTLELIKPRAEVRQIDSRIQTLTNESSQTSVFLQQLTTIIDNLPKAAPSHEVLSAIPGLLQQFTEARDRHTNIQKEISNLQDKRLKTYIKLGSDSLKAVLEYGNLLTDVNIAVRKELKLQTDEKRYRKAMHDSSERMRTAWEKWIKEAGLK